ncbi:MAG TPA: hypothetical protein VFW31_02110 [Candidatus Angelobacter sp.]|nr:hypothetical protein [Candidatus Angelobacter sp.]
MAIVNWNRFTSLLLMVVKCPGLAGWKWTFSSAKMIVFVIALANKIRQDKAGVIAKIAMTAKIAKIEKPSVNLLIQ